MSEATTTPSPAPEPKAENDAGAPATKRRGLKAKLMTLGFLVGVVVVECLVGYLWFFSPSDAAVAAAETHEAAAAEHESHAAEGHGGGHEAPASGHGDSGHSAGGHAGGHASGGHGSSGHGGHGGGHAPAGESKSALPPLGDFVEVDLGSYHVMAFQPGANAMRVIEFHLYGTIATADVAIFERLWKENQQRCRDQVIVTIRSSEVEDFTDPGLGLIKRKILARTNEVLGKPLVEEVVFSEFSFIEE